MATVTLGNGAVYTGVGLGAAVPSSPLILSTNAGLAGADPAAVSLCFSSGWAGAPQLDPAKVAGKIVQCDRGVNDRVDKSLAVKEAGGVGMILTNVSNNTLNADLHSVPTVHLQVTDRPAILAYGGTANPTASLSAGQQVQGALAPDVASFSSRGPARAGAGDILKPDIMAPGVDVLAAMSPIEAGHNFDFLSGTSMSSPHIAGIGALFKQLHPNWSPAAIKSALMTTASQTRNNNTPIAGGAFAFGAGQVVPNTANNPGLVFDAGFNDWLAFLCGTGQLTASYCPSIAIDPSNLNYPSIAIGALAGAQTVTRKSDERRLGIGDLHVLLHRARGYHGRLAGGITHCSGRDQDVQHHVYGERRGTQRVRAGCDRSDRQQWPCRAQPGRASSGRARGTGASQRHVQRHLRV